LPRHVRWEKKKRGYESSKGGEGVEKKRSKKRADCLRVEFWKKEILQKRRGKKENFPFKVEKLHSQGDGGNWRTGVRVKG